MSQYLGKLCCIFAHSLQRKLLLNFNDKNFRIISSIILMFVSLARIKENWKIFKAKQRISKRSIQIELEEWWWWIIRTSYEHILWTIIFILFFLWTMSKVSRSSLATTYYCGITKKQHPTKGYLDRIIWTIIYKL